MTPDAIITICVLTGAVVLFATELLSVDLVAIMIMITLVFTGVITPEQGVEGFSNTATITVLFMFVVSASLLKTGAMQAVTQRLAKVFRYNFNTGIILMMVLIALVSAFVNNTPVVAVFIPVIIQLAKSSGRNPSKMLIPLSFASILGGTCTLIGTSTNILINGIAEKEGAGSITMFAMAPLGVIFLVLGILYLAFIGLKRLPDRRSNDDLGTEFGMRDYLTEIELLEEAPSVGKAIMDSELVKEMDVDILEVERDGVRFTLPPGDFILQGGDLLKIRCNVDKIRSLKDRAKIRMTPNENNHDEDPRSKNLALVEMVITSNSIIDGKTLKEVDFRRRYRAVPLAIRHREEVQRERLYQARIKAGDVILAEVKTHYLPMLKRKENRPDAPFILLSEDLVNVFDRRKFSIVAVVITCMVLLASFDILHIMTASIAAVSVMVLTRVITMQEAYEAVHWKVIFLLAGALSLGTAMQNSGLDVMLADMMVEHLGQWGPVALISGLYLLTSLMTELMSNNAAAALLTPIAIATSFRMELSPMPFLMAIAFAASASFMTPIGYQTNTMVYSAGHYKFMDFIKIGTPLNLLFWLIATLLIPVFYNF